MTYIVTKGQPFKCPENIVRSAISGSWQPIGTAVNLKDVELVGVHWNPSGSAGQILQLRDSAGDIWYSTVSTGAAASIGFLTQPITLKTPFEYLCSEALNTIIIYGKYI